MLVPIYFKEKDALKAKGHELIAQLKALGIRTEFDSSEHYNPGWKFNHWEIKGVPLRMEMGPKDMTNEVVVLVRRDTGEKTTVAWADLATTVPALLAKIQTEMYERAKTTHLGSIKTAKTWDEFMKVLAERCLAVIPHCGTAQCEQDVKKQSAIDSVKLAALESNNDDQVRDPLKLDESNQEYFIP